MGQTHQPELQLLHNGNRLEDLFQVLDDIHTAASDGRLQSVTTLTNAELMSWLYELAYTAEETIDELRKAESNTVPCLRLVK